MKGSQLITGSSPVSPIKEKIMFSTQDTKEKEIRSIAPDYDNLSKDEQKEIRDKVENAEKPNPDKQTFR